MANKDMKKLFKSLEEQGFEVRLTPRGNHYIVTKDGRRITTIASTPSDHRAWANILGYLKRGGYKP